MSPERSRPRSDPLLLSIDMGYGHLRAAHALAEAFDVPVERIDAPPLATADEVRTWDRVRWTYEMCSRLYRHPLLGFAPRRFLDAMTSIRPVDPGPTNPAATRAVRFQAKMIRKGMGDGIVRRMRADGVRMVTTFYTPGLAADYAGLDHTYVVVTDSDVHRVWAPLDPPRTNLHYLAPSERARDRLRSYGVPAARIRYTGFPLPSALVGDETADRLRANLGPRLVRLRADGALRAEVSAAGGVDLPGSAEGTPPRLLLAVGGAGAQTELVGRMVRALGELVREGSLRLTLVAGVRREVADALRGSVRSAHLDGHDGVDVLHEPDFPAYWRAMNEALAGADVLWTKPSEMVFYAGLGLPLVLAPHVGGHERQNPTFALDAEAGIRQGPPERVRAWLSPRLVDGSLARAAWNGYRRLPHHGTRRIAEAVRNGDA